MLPTKKQWAKWSLPSKLTAIGAYVGVLGVLLSIFFFFITDTKQQIVSTVIAPLTPSKLDELNQKLKNNEVGIGADILSEYGGINFSSYNIAQSLKLNKIANGFEGALLLLIDNRIRKVEAEFTSYAYSNIEELVFKHGFNTIGSFNEPSGLESAVLLIVNLKLETIYCEKLGRESARIDRVFLYEDKIKPTYIVTRDYSTEMGSYAGPKSYFLEVNKNGIHYVFESAFVTSLKRGWAICRRGQQKEIICQRCWHSYEEKNSNGPVFYISYYRFFYKNNKWNLELYRNKGFWESDQRFNEEEFYETIKKLPLEKTIEDI